MIHKWFKFERFHVIIINFVIQRKSPLIFPLRLACFFSVPQTTNSRFDFAEFNVHQLVFQETANWFPNGVTYYAIYFVIGY